MVRRSPLIAAALAISTSAAAQPVDWSAAGGDLFGQPEPAALTPEAEASTERPRLAPLSQPYQDAIAEAATAHGLDEKLLHALVLTESGYRTRACSPAGACGLTQLMPGTAADLGVQDRFDPLANLRGGADYLARQILRFGDLRLALAAFNAGPARVARLGRVPDIEETRHYVATVIACYLALAAGQAPRSARDCATGEGEE